MLLLIGICFNLNVYLSQPNRKSGNQRKLIRQQCSSVSIEKKKETKTLKIPMINAQRCCVILLNGSKKMLLVKLYELEHN